MGKAQSPGSTREERLAARLRENLHRRKQQARTLSGAQSDTLGAGESGLPKEDARR